MLQVQHGFLSEARRTELRSVVNAVSVDEKMCKLYCLFHLLGFEKFKDLDAKDQATLTLIEKYCKFKQGEVWLEISSRFHTQGFEATAPDRARIQSGIDFSEQLATVVLKEQRRLQLQQEQVQQQAEQTFYRDKLEQARRERDILTGKHVCLHQSAREKEAARQARAISTGYSSNHACFPSQGQHPYGSAHSCTD
jgi:cilia- and flagella-associated protein 69